MRGQYIELSHENDGNLKIKLTDDGSVFLSEISEQPEIADRISNNESVSWMEIAESKTIFSKSHDEIWSELFEDISANSQYEFIDADNPDRLAIGGLTSSPFVVSGVCRDDNGEISNYKAVFWFPDYQIISEIEKLYREGEVIFTNADN
jgi:hypothetical protein